jgi:2-methylaconitate cis-trans-isomerase PrpF
MRGGTSRGLFFHEKDLPADRALRDKVIMGAIGAPDPRQVDGLGGGDMLLSKVAIVARSPRADADVECEFANITPGKDRPTYGTNCGNLVGAVALFAFEEGLVKADSEAPTVRVLNRNSDGLIEVRLAEVDEDSRASFRLAGMPETGARVDLAFIEPVGAVQCELIPTGNARDTIQLDNGQSVDISVVDAGALYVFVKAADLGLGSLMSRTTQHWFHPMCRSWRSSVRRLPIVVMRHRPKSSRIPSISSVESSRRRSIIRPSR